MALVFDFLFKYPPLVFEQGDFAFAASRSMMTTVVGPCGARAVAALVTYRGITSEGRRRDRLVLVVAAPRGRRAAAVLPAPAVADPEGRGAAAELSRRPDRRLAQHDDRGPRRAAAHRVRPAAVRQARQPAAARRCRSASSCGSSAFPRPPIGWRTAADLKYEGTASRLGPALERARDELAGLPLAGLVMVTDGADTSDADARRVARRPQGAVDSRVPRRRRPGSVRARHPDQPRRDAAARRSRARRSPSTS